MMIEGVLFDNNVLDTMFEATRRHSPVEAGGLMLGLRRDRHLHVVEATTPYVWDRQSRVSFFRSSRAHRMRALRLWRKSGKRIDWLGEWHSHPGFSRVPSGTDLRNWRTLVKHRKAPMVFPICDGRNTSMWLKQSMGSRPMILEAVDSDSEGTLFTIEKDQRFSGRQ